ncbi:sensor histidine kinase [Streptomyces sp. NPDC088116]|uniref:sensor histidine kinase n=1 Tax=Streptomyces sp. NPDC088116 TaxID=3365825 RepID=UPI0038041591
MSVNDWVERLGGPDGPGRYRRYALVNTAYFALIEAGLWALWVAQTDAEAPALASVAVLGAAHAAIQVPLSRAALRHYLGSGPRPGRLVALYTTVTVAMAALGCALLATGRIDEGDLAPCLFWLLMLYAGPSALAMPRRAGAVLVAVVSVSAVGGSVAAGLSGTQLGLVIGGAVFMAPVMAVAFRATGWGVRLVEELAAARQTQARLAVAEERLRFGRDLHDVLGRNLAVVALKSELAAQLARRGRPEAVDQILEVQVIAQESQREIRSVVRGYRTADLHTELAGARSVLEAAGIACHIEYGPAARLPDKVQVALGWVVREATTNVLRHAQDASSCTLSLRTAGPAAALLVMRNDGASDVPSGAGTGPGAGTGLTGLKERLTALSGTLTTERHSGGIFRLTAHIPWEPSAFTGDAGGDVRPPG